MLTPQLCSRSLPPILKGAVWSERVLCWSFMDGDTWFVARLRTLADHTPLNWLSDSGAMYQMQHVHAWVPMLPAPFNDSLQPTFVIIDPNESHPDNPKSEG